MLHQSVKPRHDRPAANVSRPQRRGTPAVHHDNRSWQERAIAAQQQGAAEAVAALQAQLADCVAFLTGHAVAPAAVYVNPTEHFALATVDGATFRLQARNLVLLLPCAYCGAGQFASAPIETLADLGHALDVWQPLHPDCEPTDRSEDA